MPRINTGDIVIIGGGGVDFKKVERIMKIAYLIVISCGIRERSQIMIV